MRDRSTVPPTSVGSTASSHIRVISRGTPGMEMIRVPWPPAPWATRTSHPGAVPCGFGMASAEGMSQACLRLRSGIGAPRPANQSARSRSSLASTPGVSPRAAAIASRVRSSSVGPRPPVVTTRSLRPMPRSNASTARPRLSPTVERWRRSMPRPASRPAR